MFSVDGSPGIGTFGQREKASPVQQCVLVAALLAVAATVLFAEVRYTGSDARGTFLLSESLLTRGTLRLDHYGEEYLDDHGYVIHEKNGHFYYYFPIGTPIASIPFVGAARLLGLDLQSIDTELQTVIAAICAALMVLILYQTARYFLGHNQSLLLALLFWFGTGLASTGATALWSHNFASLFAALSVYCGVTFVFSPRPWLYLPIAAALFMAYLCRPTLSLLVPFLLLFLYGHDRKLAASAAAGFLVLFAGFVIVSLREFGQLLPDYYMPGRLEGGDLAGALPGNLISPARGIIVYSPFLLVFAITPLFGNNRITLKKGWLLIAVGWPLLHLLAISTFFHWWGGWAYGSRLMTDALPGLYLLGINAWPGSVRNLKNLLSTAALVPTAAFSIYVNGIQGLFNPYSARWNAEPNINLYPQYLFDWRYPQFLHNERRHRQRVREHDVRFNLNAPVLEIRPMNSAGVLYRGWEASGKVHRWNESMAPLVRFELENPETVKGELVIDASYSGDPRVRVMLNGAPVGEYTGRMHDLPRTFLFNPALLKVEGRNEIRMELTVSDPRDDSDHQAFALRRLVIK